jgi:hypothetical protein
VCVYFFFALWRKSVDAEDRGGEGYEMGGKEVGRLVCRGSRILISILFRLESSK